jgi:hypothetical protein
MRLHPLALALLSAAPLAAQQPSTQPDFRAEKTVAAGSSVGVHNLNGDVTVTTVATGNRVEIVGRKHGNRRYFDEVSIEVVETSRGLMICPTFKNKDIECDERGFRVHDDRRWRNDDWDDVSIDIEVKIPKGIAVSAHSVSGDVDVVGAEGEVRAGSVSGDVRMVQLRAVSSIRASSVSGDVDVIVESLAGTGPLKFTSVSGNVTAELPKGIDADVTMRSVSGSLDSDFALTLNGRMNRHSLEARIGKGGRDLEVHTVSGDVRLRAAK